MWICGWRDQGIEGNYRVWGLLDEWIGEQGYSANRVKGGWGQNGFHGYVDIRSKGTLG